MITFFRGIRSIDRIFRKILVKCIHTYPSNIKFDKNQNRLLYKMRIDLYAWKRAECREGKASNSFGVIHTGIEPFRIVAII